MGRSLTQAQWRIVEERATEEVEDAFDEACREGADAQELLRPAQPGRLGSKGGEAGEGRAVKYLLALRMRFTLELLYATGPRREEAVAAVVDDLRFVSYPVADGEPDKGWTLRVLGKGQKLREVPVPEPVIERLKAYLAARALHPEPDDLGNRGAYLLGRHGEILGNQGGRGIRTRALGRPAPPPDPREGIGAATLYAHLKFFFGRCARQLRRADDEQGAERFAKASTYWLRHTHASHAIATGMPLEIAQQNLGHASLNTTTAYITPRPSGACRRCGTSGASGRRPGKLATRRRRCRLFVIAWSHNWAEWTR